ncbi:MAG TPA: cytochrome P450 [Steroidobacteraceae bacterium]|nr:cytochrome P450 [Steroidobacteraceae bacterium]
MSLQGPTQAGAGRSVPEPGEAFDLGASEDTLRRMTEWVAELGDFFRVYSPRRASYTYFVNDPDLVKRILLTNHKNYVKGVGTDQISILLGHGIMTSSGEYWHRQRRMLQPAFHRRIIDRFSDLIRQVNEIHAARWAEHAARGEPIEVTEAASEITLEINLRAIFGSDLEWIRERTGGNPFEIVHTEGNRDLKFAYRIRSLGGLIAELIARRRAQADHDRFDFLDMALNARDKQTGEAMTDKQLVDEVITLVVAGHETTASALAWTWFHLGARPEVQDALAHSMRDWPGVGLRGVDAAESWTVGQQVVKESLRLCPPGWMMTRRTLAADVLGGIALPPRTDVFVSPYFMHRHPEHWSNPEAFDPGRFNPEADAQRHRFAYIPFGVGPRHCIGEGLAMQELLTHLAVMSSRFRLQPADSRPPQIEARINYRLRSALPMIAVPR